MAWDPLGTAYDIKGDGPDLILVHGMGLNRRMWFPFLPDLTSKFRVICYDLLGHGESAKPPTPCNLNHLANQLYQLLVNIKVDRAIITGFSLGGTLALAMAVTRPELTTAIAVINSTHRRDTAQRAGMEERLRISRELGPAGTVETAIKRWFTDDFRTSRPDVTGMVREWMLANDPDHYATLYRVLVQGDDIVLTNGRLLVDALPDIYCPALILTCEHDANSTPAMAKAMANAIPNGQAVIVPDLRHMGLAENPGAFLKELKPFFNGIFETASV